MENDTARNESAQITKSLPLQETTGFSSGRYDISEGQADWEKRWSMHGDLSWRVTEIPDELKEACAQGWFSPGVEALDIGCGSGECTAWMARQGLSVTGADFAPSAIAQAIAIHGESLQLQFRVLDICRTAPEHQFQVLFDRGCLHIIPLHDRPAYVRQISALASPGAHFLLLHKTLGAFFEQVPSYRQTAEHIRREFQDTFDLIDIKEIMIPRSAGPQPGMPVPGLAIRLVRKSPCTSSVKETTTEYVASDTVVRQRPRARTDSLEPTRAAVRKAGIPWCRPEDIESSIPTRFEKIAAGQPAAPAIIGGPATLSYAGLNQTANRLAHLLLAGGKTPVDATGYLFGHGPDQILAMLGILKAGGWCVPIDLALPEALNREILADAGVRLIVTGDEHRERAGALAPAGTRIVNLDHLGTDLPETNPGLAISPDRLANLHYTSGSTGKPKGVMQNHRNTLHFMATIGEAWPVCPGDSIVHLVGCSFSAVVLPIWGALLNGAAVAPCDLMKVGISGLHDFLRERQITIHFSVPTLYRRLEERLAQSETRLPDLRLVVMGGEPMRAADVESFRNTFAAGCRLLNVYAGAEMYYVCQHALDGEVRFTGPTAPVGHAVEGKEVLLLDESLHPVEPGEVGQIAIRSRYLAPGYLNQPEMTKAVFLPDPEGGNLRIYLTGDAGRMDAEGCLVHMGRQGTMVKVRGQRVEQGAIEQALRMCHGVTDAAVVLRDTAGGEKMLVAYVVRQPASGLTSGLLRSALRERLPEVMVPHSVVFMDAFPVTTGGKLDHAALPPPGRARPETGTAFLAPRNDRERQLADSWAQLLELDEVGVRDNFFELGGDSILALKMMVTVEQDMGVAVPAGIIRELTVERLAEASDRDVGVGDRKPGESGESGESEEAETGLRAGPSPAPLCTSRGLRLVRTGPLWGSHALPYGAGVYLHRAFVAQPTLRRHYAERLELVRRCAAELGLDRDAGEIATISLLANTWKEWRSQALSRSGRTGRWMSVDDPQQWLSGKEALSQGVVIVAPHTGRLMAPLYELYRQKGRETAIVISAPRSEISGGTADWKAFQTEAFTGMLWQARQVLLRHGVVFIAGDGLHGERTVEAEVWGRRRPFRIGAAELAVTTGSLLVPTFVMLDATGHVWAELKPPLQPESGNASGSESAQIAAMTARYAAIYAENWPRFFASMNWNQLAMHLALPFSGDRQSGSL